jgi:N-acetylmuramoyl-L-alanine amidase-like
MYKTLIISGKYSQRELDNIIRQSSKINDISARIDFLSGKFLDLDYKESTLIGNITTPEVFVIDLQGVDCFTFIDYIEAMRLSGSFSEFKKNLKKVRYKSGEVEFRKRNHFFTDWRESNSDFIDDVTHAIGGKNTTGILKILNKKKDGTYFIPGIKPVRHKIRYIPSDAIDESVMDKLKTGDYIGIYSDLKGLDVSHVGIIIKSRDKVYLRHASSRKGFRRVIDKNFKRYIANKPGIIILRPKPFNS